MILNPIDTAPKTRDILVFGLFKPLKGSCMFKGFTVAGWDNDQKVWNSIGYNNRGFPLHVVPLGWTDLPNVDDKLLFEADAVTEEEFNEATKSIYSEI